MWDSNTKENGELTTYSVVYLKRGSDAMAALRTFFPDGQANELNFVLFSTSGVHGWSSTIEDVEAGADSVTFLIVQPRVVVLRYGLCRPETPDDFAFLKKLRQTSQEVMAKIGMPEEC